MSIGVPIKLLHESEGHTITIETLMGDTFRGKLIEAEDNMNCNMTNVKITFRDGSKAEVENTYIRGSKINYFILPDMLKNAPMFRKAAAKSASAAGRGKSAILRAQAAGRGRGRGGGGGPPFGRGSGMPAWGQPQQHHR